MDRYVYMHSGSDGMARRWMQLLPREMEWEREKTERVHRALYKRAGDTERIKETRQNEPEEGIQYNTGKAGQADRAGRVGKSRPGGALAWRRMGNPCFPPLPKPQPYGPTADYELPTNQIRAADQSHTSLKSNHYSNTKLRS